MTNIRLPGPIPLPENIRKSLSKQMINHRGPDYKTLLYRNTENLKKIFCTSNDIYILTASGTGALEAAITNTLSPGDKVLCASIGNFGERFGEIAKNFGANVTMLSFDAGHAVDPDTLRNALQKDPTIKAVLVTHNETNTGVTNNLKSISAIVKKEFNKLLLVDGISSVCSIPLETDKWQCDVVTSASQKGWVLPPGLAFISFSKEAWDSYSTSKMPKYYFDLGQYKKYYEMGQPPWTPAISIMFSLDLSLTNLIDEGLENIFKRHKSIANLTRTQIEKLGLKLLPVNHEVASNTVTAVKVPPTINGSDLIITLRTKNDIELAGGYGELKDKIFRIGHMGIVSESEINEVIEALRIYLNN